MVVEERMATTSAWKDVTSYSRSDKEHVPQSYEFTAGTMVLVVTRHIRLNPGDWQMEMQGVFTKVLYGNHSAEFAQSNCLLLARAYLRKALDVVTEELDAAQVRYEASSTKEQP